MGELNPTSSTSMKNSQQQTANTRRRADFTDTLDRLEERLAALGTAIIEDDAGLWAWSYRGDNEPPRTSMDDDRVRIAADLARIDHSNDDTQRLRTPAGADADENDGRPTIVTTALASSSPATLVLAAEVNELKDHLNRVMREMHKTILTAEDLPEDRSHWVGARLLRYQLHYMSRRRLSWHQTVRRIQIEHETPVHASFFWAALPLRYRITAEVLRRRLSRLSDVDDHPAAADLGRLDALKPPLHDSDEIIVERPPHLHPRCNLSFEIERDGHTRLVTRVRRAVMPILYAADPAKPELDLRRELAAYQVTSDCKEHKGSPNDQPPPQRRRRSDATIGPWIPIESVTAYRALPRSQED